jgi:hypothetical protein
MQLATLIVAIMALGLAGYALRQSRRANRLSCSTDRSNYELGRYVIDHLPVPSHIEIQLTDADIGGLTEN